MATTIKLKNSVTTTNAPSSLVQGEVAINITDKKVWVGNAATTPVQLLGTGASINLTSLTTSNDCSISGLTVGKGAGSVATNVVVGGNGSLGGGSQTGTNNTALGDRTLTANTSGSYNTATGQGAVYLNTTGSNNSGFGSGSLQSNTTGANNTALGMTALYSNTTASNNTAVGYQAAYLNTTGNRLVAVGTYALYDNTTGISNTAVGMSSLENNTTASYNTAVGDIALFSNTTGANNTAVGYQAGYSNTTGSYNTPIGYRAGYSNTVGTFNTTVGYNAGYSGTTTEGNTFLGIQAGYSHNVAAGNGYNTFVGFNSGYYITSGKSNTIIGSYNGFAYGLDIRTLSNHIVLSDGDGTPRAYWNNRGVLTSTNDNADNIAYFKNTSASSPYGLDITFSAATPNNTTQTFLACGDSTNYKLFIYSSGTVSNRTGTYNTISDAKLKENIVDATPKLDKLMQTRVVNYNLIGDELKQIGFVAQELETVFPSLIDNVPDLDENKQPTGEVTKSVKLTVMIPILVKAIQELNAKVEAQALEIAQLKGN